MKKITTALGALIAFVFLFSNWVNVNPKFPMGIYFLVKAMPSLGFILLGLAIIALMLLIIPIFLRNPFRKVFIVGLSLISLLLLLAFATLKGDLGRGDDIPTLGIAWYGSLFGFFIAFLGSFIKTKPCVNADGTELPIKSSLPMLSAIILLICFPVSLFAYLLLMPPFGSFPMKVNDEPRLAKVQYRNDENYPGVYMAVYGTETLHTIEKKKSAVEAQEQVKKVRESVKKDAAEALTRWKNSNEERYGDYPDFEIDKLFKKDKYAVFLADEDKPENDYVVYVSNGRANVAWASGKWFCTVITPNNYELYSAESPAKPALQFATNLPYPPNNTTPIENRYKSTYSLYILIYYDLPFWFSEWGLVVIPLIIAFPFLLLIPVLLLKRKIK